MPMRQKAHNWRSDMKALRLSDEARVAVKDAVAAATESPRLTHAEEVKALMAKGMKITVTGKWCVWALSPRKIAQALGVPFIAALPAAHDLAEYMAQGGQIVTTRV
jgi:hypothetical protein